MLGKGVVGGGGGTKAPKPSFVSYVRPEVRGRRAGGASGWSCRGEGRREPPPRCGEGRGRFLCVCGKEAGRGEALGGRVGISRGLRWGPPARAGRCPRVGPRRRRPDEGAQAG